MTGRHTPPKRRRDIMADLFPTVALTGIPLEVPGGCDECDAIQRIRRIEPLIWNTTVLHDDWCPRLARITAKAAAR